MATKTAIKFSVLFQTGSVYAENQTAKQAAAASSRLYGKCTIVGTDGASYKQLGKALVPVDYKGIETTPEQDARRVAALMSDMTRKPLTDGPGDDDDAIEDLGLGTRDDGLFRGRRG